MDPISQGVVGAVVAHAVVGRKLPRSAAVVGALAGMAPDLDIFFPTFGDVTAGWYWHRGPSHAIVMAPLVGLIVAGVLAIFAPVRRNFGWALLAAVLGALSHGPLDALTTYGTMLLWPMSDTRVSWDLMPIIDPVFTLTLVGLMIAAVISKKTLLSRTALGFATLYLSFAGWQYSRAVDAATELARLQGRTGEVRVMPAPIALSLWRAIDKDGNTLHANGVFVPYFFGEAKVLQGTSAPLATPPASFDSEQKRHFDRFQWFSQGNLVQPYPAEPLRVGDGRYSGDQAGFAPLWGLDFGGGSTRRFSGRGDMDAGRLWNMTFGDDDELVPLSQVAEARR